MVVDGTSRAEGVGRKMGELVCWADAALKSPSESVLAVGNAAGFLPKIRYVMKQCSSRSEWVLWTDRFRQLGATLKLFTIFPLAQENNSTFLSDIEDTLD